MPTFCRHNRLLHNCPICTREQEVEMRPVVSPSAPRSSLPPETRPSQSGHGSDRARSPGRPSAGRPAAAGRPGGVVVRRLARGPDDGYGSELVPGLRSSLDAARLAEELAFAATRLDVLASAPPGPYAEVAAAGEIEERIWLAFLIVLLGPVEEPDPFAEIVRVRTSWRSGEDPDLAGARAGVRGALAAGADGRTVAAYRVWAGRAGSQAEAVRGDASWTPERRFARAYERLALPGFPRAARLELLISLGAAGVCELRAASLALGGSDTVTLAAKRVFGIGDAMLLERRAARLAEASELPLEAEDLALFNWERGERARLGMPDGLEPDPAVHERVRGVLGL